MTELRKFNLILVYPQPILYPAEKQLLQTDSHLLFYVSDFIVKSIIYNMDVCDIVFTLTVAKATIDLPKGCSTPTLYHKSVCSRVFQLIEYYDLHGILGTETV